VAEDSATIDSLTGLPNARSLFLHLEREIVRCNRSDLPLAVFVADLDGFKQINDRSGHLQGNKLLQMFAERLKQSCRECDYPARMGGDEFVVVVPGFRESAATEMTERLRGILAQTGRAVSGDAAVSLSVGHAFCPADGDSAEQLLAVADRRMYRVKSSRLAKAAQAGN
jgi:diguanylate cyclase (GGDEF)-like protein